MTCDLTRPFASSCTRGRSSLSSRADAGSALGQHSKHVGQRKTGTDSPGLDESGVMEQCILSRVGKLGVLQLGEVGCFASAGHGGSVLLAVELNENANGRCVD